MDLDRGMLARLDRRLLPGLGGDERFQMVRVPVTPAKWSTWKRYCDRAGISMGRGIAALIDHELALVFDHSKEGAGSLFEERAQQHMAEREAALTKRSGSSAQPRSERGGGATTSERRSRSSTSGSGEWMQGRSCRLSHPRSPRPAATNAARADRVSSTSAAMGIAGRQNHGNSSIEPFWAGVSQDCWLGALGTQCLRRIQYGDESLVWRVVTLVPNGNRNRLAYCDW